MCSRADDPTMHDATYCARCHNPLTLQDGGAPRFLHPTGEAVCPIDNADGDQDSGEPVLTMPDAAVPEVLCGVCRHAAHWRECQAPVVGLLGSTRRCECRRRGPSGSTIHSGRPIIESIGTGVMILCPLRHVYHYVRPGEWAGSIWEVKATDPAWTVECEGTLPIE